LKSGLQEYIDNDIIFSYWIITRKCNYKCNYCPCTTMLFHPDCSQPSIDKTIEVYNELELIKPVDLIITGGEPTLKDLNYIFTNLKLSRAITIFTNLSQSVEYYVNLNSIHPLKLYCSFHPSQVNENSYIEKVNELSNYISDITIKVMVSNSTDVITATSFFNNTNKNVHLEFLPMGNPDIFDKINHLNIYKPYLYGDFNLALGELKQVSNFKGWKCSSSGNNICFDYNGDVYICKAHFQQKKKSGLTVFDNFIEEYKKLPKTIICPLNKCTSEVEIIKEKV
jgi:organic radical activating enzyme